MEVIAVFLPLLGAFIVGFFGRAIGDRGSQLITCGCMGLSAVLSVYLFYDVAVAGNVRITELFTWIDSGTFELSWALKLDTLTVVMLATVTVVSTMIHIYSIGYMSHDKSIPRFMAYLSLFHLLHADAGERGQLRSDVLRLGRRGPGLLPADRLLVRPAERLPCRDQGLPGQPRG